MPRSTILRRSLFAAALVLASYSGAKSADDVSIAFVPGLVGESFYGSMRCGALAAAAELGVTLHYSGPTDWDIALQTQFIESALLAKPQGLILVPTDGKALVTIVEETMKSGIPVITVDAPLSEPVDLHNIQSDQYAGGVLAGQLMSKLVTGGGVYLALGFDPGMPDIDGRVKGFIDALTAGSSGAEVLPIGYPQASAAKAAEIVAATIQAEPNLKGIFAAHTTAGLGAAAAISEANRVGQIKLISFDADPQQVSDLRAGVYDGLVVQEPYGIGYDAVQLLTKVIRGEVAASSIKHDAQAPLVMATAKNLDDPEVSKYLYNLDCGR